SFDVRSLPRIGGNRLPRPAPELLDRRRLPLDTQDVGAGRLPPRAGYWVAAPLAPLVEFPAAVFTASNKPDADNTASTPFTTAWSSAAPFVTSYTNTPTPPRSRFASQIAWGLPSKRLGGSPTLMALSSCTMAATTAPHTNTPGPMAISS